MGMYTELVMALELKKDTPKRVINILNYMLEYSEDVPELESHELFNTPRWNFMLRSDSYYFEGTTHSFLHEDNLYPNNPMYFLNVRCNLKDYDDEIVKFIDWIKKYAETEGFVGYRRYEEDTEPTLIYLR